MQTIEFEVTGEQKMHCVGCETRIAYVLRQLPGVRDVRANAKTQRVRVVIDAAVAMSADQIGQKLKELGYNVQPLGAAA